MSLLLIVVAATSDMVPNTKEMLSNYLLNERMDGWMDTLQYSAA